MSNPSCIRKFEYRPSRITAGFDVEFMPGKETYHGICKNVSNSGIRATFYDAVAVGSSGMLILHHPSGALELNALVAYVDQNQVGFEFVFQSHRERAMTTEFMDLVADQAHSSLIVRFP